MCIRDRVLTDGKKGMKGAIEKADELAKEIPGSFVPGQFAVSYTHLDVYKRQRHSGEKR